MAIQTTWKYGENGLFSSTIAPSERFWMSAARSARASLEVGQWAAGTLVTSNDGSNIIGVANNCRYINPTQVNIRESSVVDLTANNIAKADCTVKVSWSDDATATQLTNCKFYAFNGTDPNIGPDNMTVVAFERTDTAVNLNSVGGDNTGKAWNDQYGINTLTNALQVSSQALASSHDFYFGFSVKVLSYGTHSNAELRLSFDVS